MPDIVITLMRDSPRTVNHAATLEGEEIYIWCYGRPIHTWWFNAPEGAVVNCLTCLAYGPRADWQPHPMGRIRFDLVEGRRIGVVDTETKEDSLVGSVSVREET